MKGSMLKKNSMDMPPEEAQNVGVVVTNKFQGRENTKSTQVVPSEIAIDDGGDSSTVSTYENFLPSGHHVQFPENNMATIKTVLVVERSHLIPLANKSTIKDKTKIYI